MSNLKKIPPPLIQKLLEKEGTDLQGCEECGSINCVELVEDHLYEDANIPSPIFVSAFICEVCGDVSYSPEVYKGILQEEENFKGNTYIRVEVLGGKVIKYAVH